MNSMITFKQSQFYMISLHVLIILCVYVFLLHHRIFLCLHYYQFQFSLYNLAYIDFYRLIGKLFRVREEARNDGTVSPFTKQSPRISNPNCTDTRFDLPRYRIDSTSSSRFSSTAAQLNTEEVTILTTKRPSKCYPVTFMRLSLSSARDYAQNVWLNPYVSTSTGSSVCKRTV